MNAIALTFQNTQFDIVDRSGQPWLRGYQIGTALGYTQGSQAINKIYDRNADEFTDSMTALVELETEGGKQKVRIFSLRGCHLLGMLSRTKIAKEFRKWVLDVLETHSFPPIVQQAPEPKTKIAHKGGLSLEMQDEIKALIKGRVEVELPKEKWGAGSMRMWAAIKGKFNLSKEQSYKDLSPEHFASCISMLARLDLGDLTLPKPSKMENLINLTLDINACVQRLLVTANNGKATISQVPHDAYILTREQIKNNMHDVLPGYRLVEANLYHALEGLQTELMKQAALPSPDNQ